MHDDLPALAAQFKTATAETIDEINREAELYLNAQLTAALASDQRALVYASVLGAVLAILIGGMATLEANGRDVTGIVGAMAPMIVSVIVSLVWAIMACRPVGFRPPGNNPRQWLTDIEANQSLHESKAEMAAQYVRAIEENNATMQDNGKALKWALAWGLVALATGALGVLYIASY